MGSSGAVNAVSTFAAGAYGGIYQAAKNNDWSATIPILGAYSSNQKAHAETNANTKSAEADYAANVQIKSAKDAEQLKENRQANTTQAAQARVRAISNPDGHSLITEPLGGGANPANASPGGGPTGTIMTPGKATVGS